MLCVVIRIKQLWKKNISKLKYDLALPGNQCMKCLYQLYCGRIMGIV